MKSTAILILAFLAIGFGLTRKPTNRGGAQDKEAPTLIQVGVMSEKQREHSKLYKEYSMGQREIPIQLESGNPNLLIKMGSPLIFADRTPTTLQSFIENLACKADLIVEGMVKDKFSQLTESKDFIFTDHDFVIDEVLKTDSDGAILPHSKITITRPGGVIQLNGKTAEAVDTSFQPLKTGRRYLLFLSSVPTTGAYKAVNGRSSFEVDQNKIVKLTSENIQLDKDTTDATAFVSGVRAAILTNCTNK